MMKIYLYGGNGMYNMGSSVMCMAETDAEATRLIKENLESIDLKKESDNFKFEYIKVIDIDSAKIIYSANGEY